MMKFTRRGLLATGAATTAVAAAQLGQTKPGLAQAGDVKIVGEVNLYSSRHYNTDDALYNNFTSATGIKVNLIEAKADPLIARVKSEGKNSPADVLMTVDAGRLWKADDEGLYQPVDSKILEAQIPENLRHPKGHWFGFSKRARVIMYNKEMVNPVKLSTYEDLATSKWEGKIAIRSSSNVYNKSLVASIIAQHGAKVAEEWCAGLKKNFARPPEGNDRAQIEAAASGLAEIAIANTYYLPRYAPKKTDDPEKHAIFGKMAVFFPNQRGRGTHVNVSGAGVTRYAPNKKNAIMFLEYLASTEAQVFFAQGNNEYPVVEGTPIDPVVAGFGYPFKQDRVNISKYGENAAMAVKIMDKVGWA